MRWIFGFIMLWSMTVQAQDKSELNLNVETASRLAKLALKCVDQEYPNKLNQVISGPEDLQSPKQLHPIFYGCFDWHSSVHGHWMLTALLREFPELPEADQIRAMLNDHLTAKKVAQEIAYFKIKENRMYERTYGWAWLVKFQLELDTWDTPEAKNWSKTLQPLTDVIISRYLEFLPNLHYPIRIGEHSNTAFGLTFLWDYANAREDQKILEWVIKKSYQFYSLDVEGPARWEPGGFDFLSPCLEEAELMSRVLPADEFAEWMEKFLPDVLKGKSNLLTEPAKVSDRTDGKLVHLDGLNLSRAWSLYHIAHAMGGEQTALIEGADLHLNVGLESIVSGDYAGEHWLASFAVHALLSRKKYAK